MAGEKTFSPHRVELAVAGIDGMHTIANSELRLFRHLMRRQQLLLLLLLRLLLRWWLVSGVLASS